MLFKMELVFALVHFKSMKINDNIIENLVKATI